MTTVTWNPSDTFAATFTNGNLTIASVTQASPNWQSTRATVSFASGKYYVEYHIDANTPVSGGDYAYLGVGVANTSMALNEFLGNFSNHSLGYFPGKPGFLPAAVTPAAGVVGNTIGVAYDFTNKAMWVAINGGNWNNSSSASPATNTGGVSFSSAAGPYFAAISFTRNTGDPVAQITANFGATAFAYTAPSGFGPMSVAPVTSIALSPNNVTAGTTGQVITVTGTATAFSGSPFSISGGYGTYLTGQSVASGTSGTITLNPGIYGQGNITVTDNGGDTATLTVNKPSLGTLNVGFIGDSITLLDAGQAPASAVAVLTAAGYTSAATVQAVNGTSTQDWAPGGSYLPGALTAFASAGVSIVHIMLGTNDARTPNSFSAATHHSNMTAIVNALVAAGYMVVISKPLWTAPNANNAAGTGQIWPNDPNSLYAAGFTLDMQLVDGVHVFQGDTSNYGQAFLSPTTFLRPDDIHPANSTISAIVGTNWGVAILQRFGNATTTGGGTPHQMQGGFFG